MNHLSKLTLGALAIVSLTFTFASGEDKLPLPSLDDSLRTELVDYLTNHRMTPEDYVVSKFADHDVVILGENHRARHDPILIQKLIPRVYSAGVHILCTEFARRVDQPLIDSLLALPVYDDRLAQLIDFREFVHWSYREYVDIFRAAWELNHSLKPEQTKFRILGLNNSPEWNFIQTQEERDNPDVRKKVWHGETEKDWADVVLTQVVDKSEKALIYCGIHHGFSEYRQPRVREDGSCAGFVEDRLGRYIYNAIGKRVMTIYLHNDWPSVKGYNYPMTYPADGYIDALFATLDSTWWPVGFDTKGTPFGRLPGKTSIYSICYDSFDLGTYCDGYIFQMPFTDYEPITCIEGFFNEDNIAEAQRNAVNPWFRDKPVEEFEQTCEEEREERLKDWSRLY
jgi:hypothetical protein